MLESMTESPEVIATWVEEIKGGDCKHVEDLYRVHADFPKAVSAPLRKKLIHLNDDLIAEANAGMVTAVNELIKRGREFQGNNISGYITSCIRSAIHRFLQHNHLVRVPRDTYRELKNELATEREFVFIDLRTAFDYIGEEHLHGASLEDLCEFLSLDERDTFIVTHLDMGETQNEIAEQLNVTPPAVNQRVKKIRDRFIKGFEYNPYNTSRHARTRICVNTTKSGEQSTQMPVIEQRFTARYVEIDSVNTDAELAN